MNKNDAVLAERWLKHRDAEAFNDIVLQYANMVFRTCKRVLRNETDAEDATQESFMALVRGNVKPPTALGPWLHTVATNRALDALRISHRRLAREQKFAETSEPVEVSNWDDIQDFVDEAIEALPDELRTVIVEHFLLQRDQAAVAKELGVTRQAISQRVRRAIELIRDHLDKRGLVVSLALLTSGIESNLAVAAVPSVLTVKLAKLGLTSSRNTGRRLAAARGKYFVAKAAAVVTGAVLILASVYLYSSRDKSVEPAVSEAVSAPVTLVETLAEMPSAEAPIESVSAAPAENSFVAAAPKSAEVMHAALVGRVFDARSGAGIEGVEITAESTGDTVAAYQATTDAHGSYRIDDISLGTYSLALTEVNGYPETAGSPAIREVSIGSIGSELVEDFALTSGGILEGVATAGGKPLPNQSIQFTQYYDSPEFEVAAVQTDELGRFRVTGLANYEGVIMAHRVRSDGTTQASSRDKVIIVPGETTYKDFNFPEGRASVEGDIYYLDESNPVQASIYAFFTLDRGVALDGQEIWIETDEKGHYLIDGLPEGVLSLQVRPRDQNLSMVTNDVVLYEGERTQKDVIIADFIINCRVLNIPEGSKHVIVAAEEGHRPPIAKLTILDLANAMGEAVSWSHVDIHSAKPGATLRGLKPGDYTIRASSLPAEWSPEKWGAMGYDKFLAGVVRTRVFITVESMSGSMEVRLDFDKSDPRAGDAPSN
ncbi:MAG: sigma-70 family RNA polymerase sigma factor [Candidatus Hydrogenedentota bacterium]